MKLRILLLATLPAWAQQATILLSSGAGTPGGTVSLNINLATSGGVQPSAIQFEIDHPSSDLTVAHMDAGTLVGAAGKSLTCSMLTGATACVIAGLNPPNANVIPDGVLATVQYQLTANLPDKTDHLTISNVVISNPAGQPISAAGVGGSVSITGNPPPPPTYWPISGTVSLAGRFATVTLRGAQNATTTADGSGQYGFVNLPNGVYTITPVKIKCNFNPPSQTVTINGAAVVVTAFTTRGRCR